MLAHNFKTPVELGLTDEEFDALHKTLVLLETNKLQHVKMYEAMPFADRQFTGHFNMQNWAIPTNCGTVACLGGTAELVGGLPRKTLFNKADDNIGLNTLFYPPGFLAWNKITTEQAARALRNYLQTGNAGWKIILNELNGKGEKD